ncbi:Hypothetical Protein FCC1311_057982 [Hondaea fermentalgiana]|uniref:Glycosyl hydrolase family 32 N-terminal domain-containing protein n=1 Tax=Hondaea fermentalgiana TaxID=2315210 RepID=A0A2R5GFB1_9STRA|nr:Hypothetical Protein FCC1311_057982 [Hondaea fermentalgiana]|eukprot:GBG29577.1 Hypothetical Protein FCC1311_057982 [Hondaea fermentalgiana]
MMARALAVALVTLLTSLAGEVQAVETVRGAGDPAVPRTAQEYERCKETHRCPRAFTRYNVEQANVSFASAAFAQGEEEHAHLFADFEDWHQGTRFWNDVGSASDSETADYAHFNSFDYALLGPLEASRNANHSYVVSFNTTSLTASLVNETSGTPEEIWADSGELVATPNGTEVALFNFEWIDLGANTQILTTGIRALALLSRSSIKLGSRIVVDPATLGGFPGGAAVANNNAQGPGSSSKRVYLFTIETSATRVKEVQTVRTWAATGQTLAGSFRLRFRNGRTHSIPHDASPALFKARLERATETVGHVSVHRSARDAEGGYTWSVTFDTAVGNLPELEVENELLGIGADIEANTPQQANELGGTFALEFLGTQTDSLPFNVSSWNMARALEQLNGVLFASVQRQDAACDGRPLPQPDYGPCDNGLCANDGPGPSRELTWTVLLVTDEGNVAPTSPTAANIDAVGPVQSLSVVDIALTGVDADISVLDGHQGLVHAQSFTSLASAPTSPFSYAFGGRGGSHGGQGALPGLALEGQSLLRPDASLNLSASASLEVASRMLAPTYGAADLGTDLLGGSGGGVGGVNLRHLLARSNPAGLGGDGGGAVEIIAVNDITFEVGAGVDVSGSAGHDAFWGGGGGAGGSILIAAGGILHVEANDTLVADGGPGGASGAFPDGDRGSGGGGRIAVFAKSISIDRDSFATAIHASPGGSIHVFSTLGPRLHVDETTGAAGTSSSLRLEVEEFTQTASGVRRRSPFVANGPRFAIHPGGPYDGKPNRVTVYVKAARIDMGASVDVRSTGVALYASTDPDASVMIGTALRDGNFVHGTAYHGAPDQVFYHQAKLHRWYKLEILLDWDASTYTIRLNDEERVLDASFEGSDIASIGLHGYSGSISWFDEIFVGHDDTAGFRCPTIIEHATPASDAEATRAERASAASLSISRPDQTDWKTDALGPSSSMTPMLRHESHLSSRTLYQMNSHGLVYNSGGMHFQFRSEVSAAEANTLSGTVNYGMLLETPSSPGWEVSPDLLAASKTMAGGNGRDWDNGMDQDAASVNDGEDASTGRYYWYGDHMNPRQDEEPLLWGGIMACSTSDFKHWRNEGTMLHFTNISYDGGVPRTTVEIVGAPGHEVEVSEMETVGIGNWSGAALHAERPKVLYNNDTGKYVMWSSVHDESNEVGVAMVATADFPGGPFAIHDVFLPNGNETHDQTVLQRPDGQAVLVRTYFATVDYILPEPVMQPMWESVKDSSGEVDYGLNYHRSTYLEGYDDPNDICIQRVRKEDKEANITQTPEEDRMPVEEWIRNAYNGSGYLENYVLSEQAEPWLYETINGQGDPIVESRFLNPTLDINNLWMPSSVPTVVAKPWKANYKDGNIADNIVHSTLPDKLIGPPQIVEQRRTKYVAISLLTPDYLGLASELSIMEGHTEDGIDLASILTSVDQLGTDLAADAVPYERRFFPAVCEGGANDNEWEDCRDAPEQRQYSTVPGQVWGLDAPFDFVTEYDWSWRYNQYRWDNDDVPMDNHTHPVNFKDQLIGWFVPGRGLRDTTRSRSEFRPYDHNCFRGSIGTPGDDNYVAADDLYNHTLSQHYLKTEGADIASTRAHLREFDESMIIL